MTTIGFVGGRAVGRDVLDRRIAALREGPTASSLPRPGSAEDRQLARWLTQVILTETLCEDEAARLGLTPVDGPPLDPIAAVELGSVNTAAYRGSPWVRAVYRQVTATAEVPASWRSSPVREDRRARHQVRYGLFEHPEDARTATPADLEPLGAVTLESLPATVAAAIRARPPGTLAGPVRDALGWHVAVAEPADVSPPESRAPDLLGAARRRAFTRWIDERRAATVRLVPGLEHPGDPRQPDNHHRHG